MNSTWIFGIMIGLALAACEASDPGESAVDVRPVTDNVETAANCKAECVKAAARCFKTRPPEECTAERLACIEDCPVLCEEGDPSCCQPPHC